MKNDFDIDLYIEKVKKLEVLEYKDVKDIISACKEIFLKESNVVDVVAPTTIVGDIHGQFNDMLEMFRVAGTCPGTNFLFLGDYVDRGKQCIETVVFLLCLKIRYPQRIVLLRGNHESLHSRQYGFYDECSKKYNQFGSDLYQLFLRLFDFMPLAAIINGSYMCIHGGLSPYIQTIDQIKVLDRVQEIPSVGPLADLFWSDPNPDDKANGFEHSSRGIGFFFGKDVVNRFLHCNKIWRIIRSHQLCYEGYQLSFNNSVVTIWSAPNYCYRCGNVGAVLEVDESLNMFFNTYFSASEEEGVSVAPVSNPDIFK